MRKQHTSSQHREWRRTLNRYSGETRTKKRQATFAHEKCKIGRRHTELHAWSFKVGTVNPGQKQHRNIQVCVEVDMNIIKTNTVNVYVHGTFKHLTRCDGGQFYRALCKTVLHKLQRSLVRPRYDAQCCDSETVSKENLEQGPGIKRNQDFSFISMFLRTLCLQSFARTKRKHLCRILSQGSKSHLLAKQPFFFCPWLLRSKDFALFLLDPLRHIHHRV